MSFTHSTLIYFIRAQTGQKQRTLLIKFSFKEKKWLQVFKNTYVSLTYKIKSKFFYFLKVHKLVKTWPLPQYQSKFSSIPLPKTWYWYFYIHSYLLPCWAVLLEIIILSCFSWIFWKCLSATFAFNFSFLGMNINFGDHNTLPSQL